MLCISLMGQYPQTIQVIRRTVKFFSKSTFANAHLKIMREKHQISRGLVSIGDTRFGTLYFAGASVQRCLAPLRELCQKKIITIPVGDLCIKTWLLDDMLNQT